MVLTTHKLTKRQRHHQMNIEKQRLVRRLSKQHATEGNNTTSHSHTPSQPNTTTPGAEITPVMIEEASRRCSIDRFRALLPPKIKTRPTYPPRFARISVRALPYAAKKFSLPWMSSEDAVTDLTGEGEGGGSTLTDELLRFTQYVTVSSAVEKRSGVGTLLLACVVVLYLYLVIHTPSHPAM
jgi:hypothetical protein